MKITLKWHENKKKMLTPRQQMMMKKTISSNGTPFENKKDSNGIYQIKSNSCLYFFFRFVDWYKVEMGLILTPRRHFQMFYVQLLNASQKQTYPLSLIHFPYTRTHKHLQTNTSFDTHTHILIITNKEERRRRKRQKWRRLND